ncbi:hypothetical protein [Streptomyces sp. NPDC045251]|uniref:hypothetical protein n=1 Tax=unclassified Streptomyces TaxID=2593676 RepID=UPI0033FBEB16
MGHSDQVSTNAAQTCERVETRRRVGTGVTPTTVWLPPITVGPVKTLLWISEPSEFWLMFRLAHVDDLNAAHLGRPMKLIVVHMYPHIRCGHSQGIEQLPQKGRVRRF